MCQVKRELINVKIGESILLSIWVEILTYISLAAALMRVSILVRILSTIACGFFTLS